MLQRDLSVWLRNVPQSTLVTMVLDLTDRGTRAVEAGSTVGDSLLETLRLAARQPAQGMEPRIPDRIQVPASIAAALRSELGELEREAGFRPDTIVEEVTPDEGAEWVFDDVITQMAGRRPGRPSALRPAGHVATPRGAPPRRRRRPNADRPARRR